MNMSAREKMLVIVLAAMVILVGGFKFLIEPEIERLAKAGIEYDKVVAEKQKIKNNAILADTIDADNKNLESKISNESGIFLPELESDTVHIFIQGIMDKAGIEADTLTITDRMAKQILNPVSAVADIIYPAKTAAESIKDMENSNSLNSGTAASGQAGTAQSGASQTTSAPQAGGVQKSSQTAAQTASKQTAPDLVEMVAVTIQFQGQYDKCMKLLDEIKNSGRTVRITSFSMSATRTGQLAINVSVECYGMVKFTKGDPLNEESLPTPTGRYDPFQP